MSKAGVSEVRHAYDAVSEHNSYQNISKVLSKGGKVTLVLPGKDYKDIPDYVNKSITTVGDVHQDGPGGSSTGKTGLEYGKRDFGFVFFRYFSRGLQEGFFSGHPYEIVPGGLNGVSKGLTDLKNGVNSASKYIFKIEDTK